MPQIPKKLVEIRKTSRKDHSKWLKHLRGAFVCCIVFVVSVGLYGYFNPENRPVLQLPLANQIFFVLIFIPPIIATFLLTRVDPLSFEKRMFLKTLDAYECLETFNALSGSQSQKESDLHEAKKILEKISERLLARKEKSTSYDLIKEVNGKYVKIGELIQTKILFYLRNRKELPMIQQKIIDMADSFAEASNSRLDSCITNIESISETGEFRLKPSFLEARPRLRSFLAHSGRLGASAVLVIGVAYVLSCVFSKPLSDFAIIILGSTFVVFSAWEFKSK
ncbi:MAG: hypothetical protein OEY22_07360 [Candidatus Bathyarchaeota archaeon]|nr:hypothetical protein [Candidatus Bathyarchaeota archaeon]MDH5788414.1 hypothetical protein [Candidatus Bathyarchaeota archaeon]